MSYPFRVKNSLVIKDTQEVNKISTDETLAGNSDFTLVSESAIKAYVDAMATSGLGEVLAVSADASEIDIFNLASMRTSGIMNESGIWQIRKPEASVAGTGLVITGADDPEINEEYSVAGTRDAGSDYGTFNYYKNETENWFVVREGYWWLITSDINDVWNKSAYYGSGGKPDPIGFLSESGYNGHTGTAEIAGSGSGSIEIDSLVAEGSIYSDTTIKARSGLNVGDSMVVDLNSVSHTDKAKIIFNEDGSISAPLCDPENIDNDFDLVTRKYLEANSGANPSVGNVGQFNSSDGNEGWAIAPMSWYSPATDYFQFEFSGKNISFQNPTDGSIEFGGNPSATTIGFKSNNLPIHKNDVANKEYVDNSVEGFVTNTDGSITGGSTSRVITVKGNGDIKADEMARVSYFGGDDRTYYTTNANINQLQGDIVEICKGSNTGGIVYVGGEFDNNDALKLIVDNVNKHILAFNLDETAIEAGGDDSLITKKYGDDHYLGGSGSPSLGLDTLNVSDGAGGWVNTAIRSMGETKNNLYFQDSSSQFNPYASIIHGRIAVGRTGSSSIARNYISLEETTLHFNIDYANGSGSGSDITIVKQDISHEITLSNQGHGIANGNLVSDDAIITKKYADAFYSGGGARLQSSKVYNGAIATNEEVELTVAVTGAELTDAVIVNDGQDGGKWFITSARVSSADTVTFKIRGLDYSLTDRVFLVTCIK